jgi:hypothetical protein
MPSNNRRIDRQLPEDKSTFVSLSSASAAWLAQARALPTCRRACKGRFLVECDVIQMRYACARVRRPQERVEFRLESCEPYQTPRNIRTTYLFSGQDSCMAYLSSVAECQQLSLFDSIDAASEEFAAVRHNKPQLSTHSCPSDFSCSRK